MERLQMPKVSRLLSRLELHAFYSDIDLLRQQVEDHIHKKKDLLNTPTFTPLSHYFDANQRDSQSNLMILLRDAQNLKKRLLVS
jgi:hypothetical protein